MRAPLARFQHQLPGKRARAVRVSVLQHSSIALSESPDGLSIVSMVYLLYCGTQLWGGGPRPDKLLANRRPRRTRITSWGSTGRRGNQNCPAGASKPRSTSRSCRRKCSTSGCKYCGSWSRTGLWWAWATWRPTTASCAASTSRMWPLSPSGTTGRSWGQSRGATPPWLVTLVGALKHAAGRKGGPSPPWSSASIADWFACMRLHADWTARFATYVTLCRTLQDTLPAPTTGSKRDALFQWHQDFQAAAGWDARLTNDDLQAHRDRHCRPFVAALLPSQRDPLSAKVRKAQEVTGGRTYEEFTAKLKRGYDWFPLSCSPRTPWSPEPRMCRATPTPTPPSRGF